MSISIGVLNRQAVTQGPNCPELQDSSRRAPGLSRVERDLVAPGYRLFLEYRVDRFNLKQGITWRLNWKRGAYWWLNGDATSVPSPNIRLGVYDEIVAKVVSAISPHPVAKLGLRVGV